MDERELQRFMSRVEVSETGCWNWTGFKFNGYGRFGMKIDGKWRSRLAHRISYEHFKGKLGALLACHTCDNPSCVNPDHLFGGDHRANALDAKSKDRPHSTGPKVAFNARKTHCKRGHPLFGENLSSYSKKRVCKTCQREYQAQRKAAARNAAREQEKKTC